MAAKLDKEMLAKNQFWIGLGVFVLCWLIGVILVMAGGDDKPKKAWEDAKGKVEKAKSPRPKTAAYQEPWNKHGETYSHHKDKVWRTAWEWQKDMYTWPEDPDHRIKWPLYPEEPFASTPTEDVNAREKYRNLLYKTQFDGLEQAMTPVEFAGGFDRIVPKQTWDPQRTPTREEIWLAQEDFWVRRELLSVVREAVDAVAWFKEVKVDPKEKLPEGILGRRLFRNPNWELNLLFEKVKDRPQWVISGKSTIKNINVAEVSQILANPRTGKGLPFRLWNPQKGKYDFEVSGEALAYGEQAELKETYKADPINLQKDDFAVEQVLEWELSPVRRIDLLELGKPAQSHRTILTALKIREDLKKLDPEPAEPAAAPAAGAGGAPGAGGPPGGRGSMMGGGMAGPGGAAAATVDSTRVNQIPRPRYLHVKEQARHLPIAMRLIVDQNHINDVLGAVANSRLRVQVTQVTMLHTPNVQRGSHESATTSYGGSGMMPGGPRPGAGAAMGGMFGSAMGGGFRGSMQPPGMGSGPRGGGDGRGGGRPGMRPPVNPSGSAGAPGRPGMGSSPPPGAGPGTRPGGAPGSSPEATAIAPQDNARLVELVVYGLATLYERFPPRSKDAAPGTPAGTPTPTAPKP